MSGSDRQKWDRRYRSDADRDPGEPSAVLRKALSLGFGDRLPASPGELRALDLACGRGRNALFLAGRGFSVDAVDLSGVALECGRQAARQQGLAVNWLQADLDAGLPPRGRYDLVVMCRYLNLALLAEVMKLLTPGGVLVVEVHLAAGDPGVAVNGPSNRAYLAAPGALAAACADLEVLSSEEGLVRGPSGRIEALSRMIGRRVV